MKKEVGFWGLGEDRGERGYGSVRTLLSGLWCRKDDIFFGLKKRLKHSWIKEEED